MNIELPWIIIDKYFQDNPNLLAKHHLDSFNDFFNNGLKRIFKEIKISVSSSVIFFIGV